MATEDDLERRRDELRRIVFGDSGEPPAEVAAELAAVERELAAVERQLAARGGSAVDAAKDVEGARRLSRGWALLVAAGVLLLVIVGLAVLAPVRESLSPPRGLEVFDRPPTAEEQDQARDVVARAHLGARGDVVLRSLGHVVGYEFWAMLDDDQVCLLSRREFFFDWLATCTSLERFATYGLTRWISVDDIGFAARPFRAQPDDIVVVSWGPRSSEVEWRVAPGS
ncbi:hypothetical protein J7E25_16200 [Agromyces sp. ISL-38]|uniref:hypothetical protein n=1 Tax=Agromyces sp. ISL-38 TaxID=2819107 RepID=UPI001BE987C6|nr:hypothetical protein [Agromyces sp. ISL-38]MBT2500640.1 hypothetical protein [Agromyces sp. ISL-38]MBT2516581.1 hypothetical protein [Streptomyces sp. ISL-90]